MASCLRGALPPVDFLAVCFVRAIASGLGESEDVYKEAANVFVVSLWFELSLSVAKSFSQRPSKGRNYLEKISPLQGGHTSARF